MWITRTSINQPVFATMVMLALVVLGVFSYRLLPVEQMPEINMPRVFISVPYPGASPEAIESDVIKPIENVVNSVDGVKNLFGTAREGVALLEIEFRLDTDIAVAAQEVRDKVAQIRSSLPRDIRDPTISRATNDTTQGPVVALVVYSDKRSLREVSTLTDQQIVKRLQNSPGVGNVYVSGEFSGSLNITTPAFASTAGTTFVAKIDGTGATAWAKQLANAEISALTTGADGSLYVAGVVSGAVDLGGGAVTYSGSPDPFIAHYAADGSHVWSRVFAGAVGNQTAVSIAVAANGTTWVGYEYQGTIDFGMGSVTTQGGTDIAIIGYVP